MARKRKSKPTSAKRNKTQRIKDRYAHAREDAQLAGVIATTPEDALKNERVDPSSQDEQRFPGLDRRAIREDGKGWSVPEHVKRKVIETSAEVVFERKTYIDKEGVERELPPDRYAQAQAAKVLLTADEKQYERDNPEAAGKAKGKTEVDVTVNQINLADLFKAVDEQRRKAKEVGNGLSENGTSKEIASN